MIIRMIIRPDTDVAHFVTVRISFNVTETKGFTIRHRLILWLVA